MRRVKLHRQRIRQTGVLPAGGKVGTRGGAAAVEFALIAPILAVLITGMMETGRAFMVKEVLGGAARRACQVATLPSGTNSKVTTAVNNILTDNNINTGAATISVLVNGTSGDVKNAKANDKISITVSVPASAVAWTKAYLFVSAGLQLSETVVMMRQG